eukprot:1159258-Pelagomonas_calceolata.AAC.7
MTCNAATFHFALLTIASGRLAPFCPYSLMNGRMGGRRFNAGGGEETGVGQRSIFTLYPDMGSKVIGYGMVEKVQAKLHQGIQMPHQRLLPDSGRTKRNEGKGLPSLSFQKNDQQSAAFAAAFWGLASEQTYWHTLCEVWLHQQAYAKVASICASAPQSHPTAEDAFSKPRHTILVCCIIMSTVPEERSHKGSSFCSIICKHLVDHCQQHAAVADLLFPAMHMYGEVMS